MPLIRRSIRSLSEYLQILLIPFCVFVNVVKLFEMYFQKDKGTFFFNVLFYKKVKLYLYSIVLNMTYTVLYENKKT